MESSKSRIDQKRKEKRLDRQSSSSSSSEFQVRGHQLLPNRPTTSSGMSRSSEPVRHHQYTNTPPLFHKPSINILSQVADAIPPGVRLIPTPPIIGPPPVVQIPMEIEVIPEEQHVEQAEAVEQQEQDVPEQPVIELNPVTTHDLAVREFLHRRHPSTRFSRPLRQRIPHPSRNADVEENLQQVIQQAQELEIAEEQQIEEPGAQALVPVEAMDHDSEEWD